MRTSLLKNYFLFFVMMTILPQANYCLPDDQTTVRVLVINFDPLIPQKGNQPLHIALNWKDPHKLSDGYIEAIKEVSDGYINYKIVEWLDTDAFPVKVDGFTYTPESFVNNWEKKDGWHQPDGVDYEKLVVDYKVVDRINKNEIDELWIFGAPYMGFWESAMAGPGAFYINGGVYDSVKVDHPFVIMGFSYERGVAEMLHDLSHRTESTMARIYGGWEIDKLTTNWAKFAANEFQSKSTAAVGTCHYPPNGEKDYDYKNPRVVESNADEYLDYPNIKGITKKVSCETWGGPDYHLNYMKWWFTRIPKAAGINEDGRLNNWWEYIFNFNSYTEDGKAK
ncbi:MAG: hypothetical protein C4539_05315 [Ignavibacteriales bacterium]|nr:MAG: hypothetical protein C4539_05315 [Ignavibacteriales bacterium]